jgi:ABC-type transport system involved in multi-copper enzyme maturation permease subunit
MFGALFFDRDPLRLEDVPAGLISWLQDAGGFAAAGLVLWLVFGLPRWRPKERASVPAWQSKLFVAATALAALGYAVYFVLFLFAPRPAPAPAGPAPSGAAPPLGPLALVQSYVLALAGACAMVPVGVPFVRNLSQLRFRRIYALAKLSFKEAVRRRAVYACSGVLLVVLFGSWFIQTKPADQVRTYVGVVYAAMTFLLLFVAVLLASFSIPTDIKQQTIHTVVTKPVERFEVLLGRFLGFLALMTLVLVLMTGVSLLYVLREVNPEAAAESLKARVPLYGELEFENTGDRRKGTNVGREWDYRSYITWTQGPAAQTARWDFRTLPTSLAGRQTVLVEFGFDVYRTTKGKENEGPPCDFILQTWRYQEGNDKLLPAKREQLRKQGQSGPEVEDQLVEEFGYYVVPAKQIEDYTTQSIDVPGALFRSALRPPDAAGQKALKDAVAQGRPLLQLRVRCGRTSQYVGMAKYDLYLRQDQPASSEKWGFAWNFFKASFGLWLRLALLIGLAVALSTYLSGVITMLVAVVLYFGGLCQEYIRSFASGTNIGGGPMEAVLRLSKGELTGPRADEDAASASARLVFASDETFRWLVRRILNLIPDVDRFDLTPYLAEGFSIGNTQMWLDLLLLTGYLLPWAVLAFYLMKWREVASPN